MTTRRRLLLGFGIIIAAPRSSARQHHARACARAGTIGHQTGRTKNRSWYGGVSGEVRCPGRK
jgi:hypothetical protein